MFDRREEIVEMVEALIDMFVVVCFYEESEEWKTEG